MKKRILLADDEALERRALSLILSQMDEYDLELIEASNGRQAVEAALKAPISLALLDVRMPGMDGIAAARELKAIDPKIRIIFVTAFDSFDYAREALRLGVDEYLVKPAEAETVKTTVRKALNKGEEERSFRESLDEGKRIAAFMKLHGQKDYLTIILRPTELESIKTELKGVRLRQLAEYSGTLLRSKGWQLVSGITRTEVQIFAAMPKEMATSRLEKVKTELEECIQSAAKALGFKIAMGASPYSGSGESNIFATSLDALSLTREKNPLVILMPSTEDGISDKTCCGDALVEKALDFMRAHLADDCSLNDAALSLSCSPFYLSRMFSSHTGTTFVQAFTRLRIDAAKALLRTGQYSVKEAGILMGFSDPAYFTRVFKKLEGITPTHFKDKTESP
ncbi:two-component system response regulator YesN [Treponema sp.]